MRLHFLITAVLIGTAMQATGQRPYRIGEPYHIGGAVTAPRVISKVEPEYSPEARAARRQGTVILQLVVTRDGAASDIHSIRPLGYGLDEKAIEAIKQWRFEPGKWSGQPVAVITQVRVNFRLPEENHAANSPAAPAPFSFGGIQNQDPQLGNVTPKIILGQRFAHAVRFPEAFQVIPPANERMPLELDHFKFRSSPKLADLLLVAGCYRTLSEICSTKSFVIDTAHGYRTRPTDPGEWEHGLDIPAEDLEYPTRGTLKQELAKPPFLRAMPVGPYSGGFTHAYGYKYRGNEYERRGDWIIALTLAHSEDGSLMVLSGVDKRKSPNQEQRQADAEVYTQLRGLVTIDVFASDPSHHIAAVDLDCHMTVNAERRRVMLVGSRWLAIGLDPYLQTLLLFDFKPAPQQ